MTFKTELHQKKVKTQIRKHHRLKCKLTSFLINMIDAWYLTYPGVKPFFDIKAFPDKYANHSNPELYCVDDEPISSKLKKLNTTTTTINTKKYPKMSVSSPAMNGKPKTTTKCEYMLEEVILSVMEQEDLVSEEQEISINYEFTNEPQFQTVFSQSKVVNIITETAISQSKNLKPLVNLLDDSVFVTNQPVFQNVENTLKINTGLLLECSPIQLLEKDDITIKQEKEELYDQLNSKSDIIDELLDDVVEKDKIISSLLAAHTQRSDDYDQYEEEISRLHDIINSLEDEISTLRKDLRSNTRNNSNGWDSQRLITKWQSKERGHDQQNKMKKQQISIKTDDQKMSDEQTRKQYSHSVNYGKTIKINNQFTKSLKSMYNDDIEEDDDDWMD